MIISSIGEEVCDNSWSHNVLSYLSLIVLLYTVECRLAIILPIPKREAIIDF